MPRTPTTPPAAGSAERQTPESSVRRLGASPRPFDPAPCLSEPERGSGAAQARFVVVLPFPPALNHLYRHVGQRTLLSAAGRRYGEVAGLCVSLALGVDGNTVPEPPHAVTLLATPPDRRRRDIDGIVKRLLDVVYAGIGIDDSRIDRLVVEWRRDGRAPCVEVVIEQAPPATGAAREGE